jgi:hypothetical protein
MNAIDKNRNVLNRLLNQLRKSKTDLENSLSYMKERHGNARTTAMTETDILFITEEIAALEEVLGIAPLPKAVANG